MGIIAELNRQISELDTTLAAHFETHPDADIYRSAGRLRLALRQLRIDGERESKMVGALRYLEVRLFSSQPILLRVGQGLRGPIIPPQPIPPIIPPGPIICCIMAGIPPARTR